MENRATIEPPTSLDLVADPPKKRTSTAPPYLSWCLIVRNCAKTLRAALESLRARTPNAEIVIVDTMSSDDGETEAIAKEYADVWVEWAGPRGTWDREMPYFDDAAAARQHSFALAHGVWRGWIDADDVLPGPARVQELLRKNNRLNPGNAGDRIVPAGAKPQTLEDLLHDLERDLPEADCVYAPYLYQRDANDEALIWQTRERIVRWGDGTRWKWSEKAHEVLVPIAHLPPFLELSHLLFLHEKEFSEAAQRYALQRHWDVLLAQYNAGEQTPRRCTYLAMMARYFAPARELAFLEAAHACATTQHDRYNSLTLIGTYWAERGLYSDALEPFGAAVTLLPELPDAWLVGAAFWEQCNDFARAVEWYQRGLACTAGQMLSGLNPRHHVTLYPTRYALVLERQAALQIQAGLDDDAEASLLAAVTTMAQVHKEPALSEDDRREAHARTLRLNNQLLAHREAKKLVASAQYLLHNDEPLKVLALLQAVPWNLVDHPLVLALQTRMKHIQRHTSDPAAYRAFYRDHDATGLTNSPLSWLQPENALDRVKWAAAFLNEHYPQGATVLDVGCLDGIVAIPLALLCPQIKILAFDIINDRAITTCQERVAAGGLEARIECFHGDDLSALAALYAERHPTAPPLCVDVALWFEVIEHVPSPAAELAKICRHVAAAGHVLLSTPFGSFDAGHPPMKNNNGVARDNRGHLRALLPRDVVEIVADAQDLARTRALNHERLSWPGMVCELEILPAPAYATGDSLVAAVQVVRPPLSALTVPPAPPVNFVVAGALWDWNSRTVEQGGIGASEEMIIYLARALAAPPTKVARSMSTLGHPAHVFGPVPQHEVHHRVGYWPRDHVRHIRDGKIVVSRAPSYAARIDQQTATRRPLILWLQDTHYPDLTPAVAARYEKIVVVSEWHKQLIHETGVPLDQLEVLYNFVLPAHFQWEQGAPRKADHFIYASSPDRGLIKLLQLWPQIRARLPEATLDIFYGWRGCEVLGTSPSPGWAQRYEKARHLFETLKYQPGVRALGMVDHVTLANTMMRAGVWAYPSGDNENGKFHETCCTMALKARAAGMIPVCPPTAALAETAKCKETFFVPEVDAAGFDEEFVDACVGAALDPTEDARKAMSDAAITQFGIDAFLPRWRRLLEG